MEYKAFIYFLSKVFFDFVSAGHLNNKKCGVTVSDSPIHQHPWLVVLDFHYRRQVGSVQCGGTLVSSHHIITSAHCVEYGRAPIIMIPRLGEYNKSSDYDCFNGVCSDPVLRMVIDRVVVHPGFRPYNMSDDLAILVLEAEAPYTGRLQYRGPQTLCLVWSSRGLFCTQASVHTIRALNDMATLVLEAEVPYRDFIRPICLPTGFLDNSTLFYASGFGETPNNEHYSDIKKDIPLPYYPNCMNIYKKIPKDLICAGGLKNFDTCNGDSGGPLVKINGTAELWGVTKAGRKPCGVEGKPGVYTSVAYHLDWINKVIETTVLKKQTDEVENNSGQLRAGFSLFFLLLLCFELMIL